MHTCRSLYTFIKVCVYWLKIYTKSPCCKNNVRSFTTVMLSVYWCIMQYQQVHFPLKGACNFCRILGCFRFFLLQLQSHCFLSVVLPTPISCGSRKKCKPCLYTPSAHSCIRACVTSLLIKTTHYLTVINTVTEALHIQSKTLQEVNIVEILSI